MLLVAVADVAVVKVLRDIFKKRQDSAKINSTTKSSSSWHGLPAMRPLVPLPIARDNMVIENGQAATPMPC